MHILMAQKYHTIPRGWKGGRAPTGSEVCVLVQDYYVFRTFADGRDSPGNDTWYTYI